MEGGREVDEGTLASRAGRERGRPVTTTSTSTGKVRRRRQTEKALFPRGQVPSLHGEAIAAVLSGNVGIYINAHAPAAALDKYLGARRAGSGLVMYLTSI